MSLSHDKSFFTIIKEAWIYILFFILLTPSFYLLIFKIDWVDTIQKLKKGEIVFDDRDLVIQRNNKKISKLESKLNKYRKNLPEKHLIITNIANEDKEKYDVNAKKLDLKTKENVGGPLNKKYQETLPWLLWRFTENYQVTVERLKEINDSFTKTFHVNLDNNYASIINATKEKKDNDNYSIHLLPGPYYFVINIKNNQNTTFKFKLYSKNKSKHTLVYERQFKSFDEIDITYTPLLKNLSGLHILRFEAIDEMSAYSFSVSLKSIN